MEFSSVSKVIPCENTDVISVEPEVLAGIANVVQEASQDITSIASVIQTLSNSTADGVWIGNDADTFRTKAEELVNLFNTLNQEIAIDGEWAAKAGSVATDTVSENTSAMSRL